MKDKTTKRLKGIRIMLTEAEYQQLEDFTKRLWYSSMSDAARDLWRRAMDDKAIVEAIETENGK